MPKRLAMVGRLCARWNQTVHTKDLPAQTQTQTGTAGAARGKKRSVSGQQGDVVTYFHIMCVHALHLSQGHA